MYVQDNCANGKGSEIKTPSQFYYRSTNQETAVSDFLKIYCMGINYFHFDIMGLEIVMLHVF